VAKGALVTFTVRDPVPVVVAEKHLVEAGMTGPVAGGAVIVIISFLGRYEFSLIVPAG